MITCDTPNQLMQSTEGRMVEVERIKDPEGGVDMVVLTYNHNKGSALGRKVYFPDVSRCNKKVDAVLKNYLSDKDNLGNPINIWTEERKQQLRAKLRFSGPKEWD